MVNVPIKVDGVDVVTASEFNSIVSEIKVCIESLGLTLNINILDQLRKAVSGYCRGLECKDTGSINTYVLSRANTNLIDFNNVYDGMVISFKTTNVNTGVSTVNFNNTGVKNIVINNSALTGGEIQANTYNFLTYNLANDNFELSALPLKSYVDSAIANITLEKASVSEVQTGTNDTKYVTPLGVNSVAQPAPVLLFNSPTGSNNTTITLSNQSNYRVYAMESLHISIPVYFLAEQLKNFSTASPSIMITGYLPSNDYNYLSSFTFSGDILQSFSISNNLLKITNIWGVK